MGTVDIPQGNYTIMNMGASPFTAVNLTLTVNSTPYTLSHVLTGHINDAGQCSIGASPTELTFNTATANGSNPADLLFSYNAVLGVNNYYAIGSDSILHFEAAYTIAGSFVSDLSIPVVFGTASTVPEPATMLLFSLGLAGLAGVRRFKK